VGVPPTLKTVGVKRRREFLTHPGLTACAARGSQWRDRAGLTPASSPDAVVDGS
jgi:hypothetical protein